MAQFTWWEQRFISQGIDLVNPIDQIPDGKLPYIQGIVPNSRGFMEPVRGANYTGVVASGKTPLHSMRSLVDRYPSTQGYGEKRPLIIGSGDTLYVDYTGAFTGGTTTAPTGTSVSGSWSGKPLSMVQYAPLQSSETWMYVADTSKMEKLAVRWTGVAPGTPAVVNRTVGIDPPTEPPKVMELAPVFKTLLTLDNAAAWTLTGDTGSQVPSINTLPRNSITVTSTIWYDNAPYAAVTDIGPTGWCSFTLSSPELQERQLITNTSVFGQEEVFIAEVYRGTPSAVTGTVTFVEYDPVQTTIATLVLSKQWVEVVPNCLLMISGVGYRVLSVAVGKNKEVSVRVEARSNGAIAQGNVVYVATTYRAYTTKAWGSGNTLSATYVNVTMSTGYTGTHTTTATRALIADASVIGDRKVTGDDYMHLSVKGTQGGFKKLKSMKVMLDVASGATHDFTQNAYFIEFTPEEIQKAINMGGTGAPETTMVTQTEAASASAAQASLSRQADAVYRETEAFRKSVFLQSSGRLPNANQAFGEKVGDTGGGGTGSGGGAGGGTGGAGGTGGTGPGSNTGDNKPPGADSDDPDRRRPIRYPPGYYPPSNNLPAGSEWVELTWRISDMVRIGSDMTRSLQNIAAIRFEFTTVDAVQIQLHGLYIRGTHGLDSGEAWIPYFYRYRYRDSTTGVRSNWSPPSREPIYAIRTNTTLIAYRSTNAAVDQVDFERFGGTLNRWVYIGSIANELTPTAPGGAGSGFNDVRDDLSVAASEEGSNINYRLWPVIGKAATGGGAAGDKLIGTYLKSTGGGFNTSWAPGTIILIGGNASNPADMSIFTLYRVHSTTVLEVYENGGALTSPIWSVPEPVLQAKPLPILIGPWENRVFGCGDDYNPGRLYYSNPEDPDSCRETNYIDITGPSEPLMNGCVYNGAMFLWSTDRMFQILPDGSGYNDFYAREVPSSKGLVGRYAFCVGPVIWFASKDGVYETEGGAVRSITDDSIRPLWNVDGRAVSSINDIACMSVNSAVNSEITHLFRLAYHNGYLRFIYPDVSGFRTQFVYYPPSRGWYYIDTSAPACFYPDEGQINRILVGGAQSPDAQLGFIGSTGAGNIEVWSPAFTAGNSWAEKLFGDFMVDANTGGETLTVRLFKDLNTTQLTTSPGSMSTLVRTKQRFEIDSGAGSECRDVTLRLTQTNTTTDPVQYFMFGLSHIIRPEDTGGRRTDEEDLGDMRAKWLQGCRIMADTGGSTKSVKVIGDDEMDIATLSINHAGKEIKAYSWTPQITHLVKLVPQDTVEWKLYDVEWVWEPEPELVLNWVTQVTTHDGSGYVHLRDAYIALRSTSDVTFKVIVDGTEFTYTIPSTGGYHKKTYIVFQPMKGKAIQYSLTASEGFRLYQKDCEVRVKVWGSPEGYQSQNPFGDVSRVQGAAI